MEALPGVAAGPRATRYQLISMGDPQASTPRKHPALSSRPDSASRHCFRSALKDHADTLLQTFLCSPVTQGRAGLEMWHEILALFCCCREPGASLRWIHACFRTTMDIHTDLLWVPCGSKLFMKPSFPGRSHRAATCYVSLDQAGLGRIRKYRWARSPAWRRCDYKQ